MKKKKSLSILEGDRVYKKKVICKEDARGGGV